ncbi:competence protein [Bacillus sp. BGMRC 2118]|nr:competence protein [Bacillus sp. BGMRC 2118]
MKNNPSLFSTPSHVHLHYYNRRFHSLKQNDHYEISPLTLAILPAYHETYQSRILDIQGEFYSNQRPLKLIEQACLEGGASYDGRRKSLQYKKSFHQYPPIPINPLEDIYAFPTCSPDSYDCIWLFYEHILHYRPQGNQLLVTFHNHQTLELNISPSIMDKQIARTESCIVLFTKPKMKKMFYPFPSL